MEGPRPVRASLSGEGGDPPGLTLECTGCKPQFRQTEAISVWLIPIRLDNSRLDQWVNPVSAGVGSIVATTTAATSTTGGRPERG